MALYVSCILHNLSHRILTMVTKRLLNHHIYIYIYLYLYMYLYLYLNLSIQICIQIRKEEKFPRSQLLETDRMGFKSSCLLTKGQTDKDQSPTRGGEHQDVPRAALVTFPFVCGIVCMPLAMKHAQAPDLKVVLTTAVSIRNYLDPNYKFLICARL